MPSKTTYDAFKARLGNPWNGFPVGDVDTWETPPEGVDAFLVVEFPVVNSEKPVLGRTYWEQGAARLVLSVKKGIGLSDGLAWADSLASLFRTHKFGGIETFVPSTPIVNDANDDGNWFELAVIVPFRFQFDD